MMDPFRSDIFPCNFHNSPIFPPTLTDYCVYTMHAHALIFTGLLRRIRRIRTGNIESLNLVVASLQGSHAGQNIFKISGIFKFDVLLGLTRI